MPLTRNSTKTALSLEDFFEVGKIETASPFITPSSRHWGANLTLKAAILSAILLCVSFALSFYPTTLPLSHLILVIIYFLSGVPALIESIEDLAAFEINIDLLMTVAAFSSIFIGSGMEGALLLVLFAISGSMEDFVTTKAKSDISSLHKLSPTKACVVEEDGTLVERSVNDVQVNNTILIRSSQLVPLDGIVISGISSVNLVHLTGENLPITKQLNDEVPAGARNLEGALTLRVTRSSSDSTLAQIIQLVTQAQEERPVLQRWFEKLSKRYAIGIMSTAAFLALVMPLFINIPYLGVEGSIYRSLAFLIAASPCALIIAIPVAYLSAIGVCARQGILLKGGIALDALAKCRAIAFDKTGTLTSGNLNLISVERINHNNDINQALAVAYAMERNAVHPIAKAIVSYGEEKQLPAVALKTFESIPGYGLKAVTDEDQEVYIGNADYLLPKLTEVDRNTLTQLIQQVQDLGELVAVLLIAQNVYLLRFEDILRPRILTTIQELKKNNLRLIMLTGDHEASARKVATALNIDEYYADLRPEDKLQHVTQLSQNQGLAMVGDGINDAPALARATVGICMGQVGSTAAIDAADVILLQDNIDRLGWLIRKARNTQTVVKQNLVLATLAILVASLPALAGIVPLWLAVVMHEGGTVLVGLNGLRLLRK
ncbi:MAG: cation-translocating P-type ATPase [Parachlamydiaceae bacterium]|nr:cation-translocating P-type ATPase [Parachlamydiaceae bacterium]